ncbi:MAG TPA: citrate lyase subunit alpha, partial [bacterium]|nr:citrate lyase subunit alpha [bacterium]
WQNCLFARCTILAVPSVRDRIPVVVDRVTTLVGPGELIDVVATERGIAINPRRHDLLDAVKGSGLPLLELGAIQQQVERLCGGAPAPPALGDDVVATIQWVDGTTIDCVRKVETPAGR